MNISKRKNKKCMTSDKVLTMTCRKPRNTNLTQPPGRIVLTQPPGRIVFIK